MHALAEAKLESLVYPDETIPALTNIDLSIFPGQFIVLDGPSESGKSALCRCLAGVIPHFEPAHVNGAVTFEAEDLAEMRLPETAGKIGLIRDEPDNQLFGSRVEEDLAFGPCNLLLHADEIDRRVKQALKIVGLEGFGERRIETLSGGEMGRAALAATLTLHPRLIILDRAADMLDPSGRAAIYRQLRAMCRNDNVAALVVDSKADDILPDSDRVLVMDSGTITFDGHPRRFAERRNSLRGRRVLKTHSMRSIATAPGNTRSTPDNITQRSQCVNTTADDSSSRLVIQIRNVSFAYQEGQFSLRDLSLNIYDGEFVAILGNNGAGKTTLVKFVNGLLMPERGTVTVNGLETTHFSTAELSRHVGFLSQHPSLQICTNSVRAEVGFALKVRGMPSSEADKRVAKILQRFGLTDVADEHPYRLSRSRLQRVALASCMIAEPSVLVVDEPTSHMTYPHNWETMDIIAQFNCEGGTVLMVGHDLELAEHFCSRTIAMEKGRIVSDITKQSDSLTRQRSCSQ